MNESLSCMLAIPAFNTIPVFAPKNGMEEGKRLQFFPRLQIRSLFVVLGLVPAS